VTPASTANKPTVKKEPKTTVVTAVAAKSDSSFFSAPKPKPKLPSFKKAPVQAKEPQVAQPSTFDPFQEALKGMSKRRESPAVSTPPSQSSATTTPAPQTGLTKKGKKRKSVTWAPEGKLEMVKFIEKAIYDDDPADVSSPSLQARFGPDNIAGITCCTQPAGSGSW
jgi:protein phosphatase 1 regulatory subunit 10